jgi:hypothetical protein
MLGIAEAMMSEPELPADLDPRYARRTGASVIERGLPELPEVLTYQMSIPVVLESLRLLVAPPHRQAWRTSRPCWPDDRQQRRGLH